MKVVLAMAVSLNGLAARENGEEDWLPSEGWSEFLLDAKSFGNIVMGRETYELVKRLYKDYDFDSVETGYKVIVTRNKDFQASSNYLIAHSPEGALALLESKNLKEVLLIGGGKLNTAFIAHRLIDEVWLTINPYIIGSGRPFISPADFDLPLELIDCKQLSKGRIKIRYSCVKQPG